MAITPEMLMELIESAIEARQEIEDDLRELAKRAERLERERDEIRLEEQGYRLALARHFPDSAPVRETSASASNALFAIEDGIATMARTDAVEFAVRHLSREPGEVATPAEIEEFLRARGRDDSRDAIGAALAYLNRNGRVQNVSRGRWQPAKE